MIADSTYRERFRLTMEHKPVDRCPIDLGGTPQSTVDSPEAIVNLAAHLGFTGAAPDNYDKFDRRVLDYWDIDFRRAGCLVPFENERSRQISSEEHVDGFGITYKYTGLYWEIVGHPLKDATIDDIKEYDFPRPYQAPAGLISECAARARELHDCTNYVVVGEHPVFGVLELACWLCGYDHIMLMMAAEPEFVHLLFTKILNFQKDIIHDYYQALGPYIHLTTSGDDFGTQKGLFVSPEMFREFVKPYLRERIAYTAKFTDAVYMHHSCGAIFDIIPDLIEIGVRILNPIQPAATGMDPRRLKETFGDKLVFHGGLDTQDVLPSGDADRIEHAVQDLLEAMRPWASGGYIFAPAHNLQVDVSPGAVAHMYEAVFDVCESKREDQK